MWVSGTRTKLWGCLLLEAGCMLVRNDSACGQSQTRFCWITGLWLEAGSPWGTHPYFLIIIDRLIVPEVSRQLCQLLCWHMRHGSQSNQKAKKAYEWWKERQEPQIDGSTQSCRGTEELAKCSLHILSPLLKSAVAHLEERSTWANEKGEKNWNCALKKRPIMSSRLRISWDKYTHRQIDWQIERHGDMKERNIYLSYTVVL